MIELALPSGSLENAIMAFESGADAVYFGMKDFSARKGAVNFTREDLSKVRRYATDHDRKIYVTVNTLIDDGEIESANRLMAMLDFYQPDGIIIQDLGLVQLARRLYPALPLHGSTQLAVHTVEGVKAMQDLGFERVVLSRELTLKEIEKIRVACPDIELKVFIHGALCYGFSGLCMASANICGRSANRGECAQICRSWFTDSESGKRGYFFSLEDLCAGENLRELDAMGIESAKIEGRLKGDAYIQALCRYYKDILAGGDGKKALEDVKTSFSRKAGDGYFHLKKERESLLSGYPRHMGIECGRVVAQSPTTLTIEATRPLLDRDGVMFLTRDSQGLVSSEGFSVHILLLDGKRVMLKYSADGNLVGKTLYKISASNRHLKVANTSIPLYKKSVDVSLTLEDDRISASGLGKEVSKTFTLQEAAKPRDTTAQLEEIFSQSDRSPYSLGSLTFTNSSQVARPFLPASVLKELRRDFYSAIDEIEAQSLPGTRTERPVFTLPDRKLLCGDLPWSLEVKSIDGNRYSTLPPVSFEEEALFKKVDAILEAKPDVIVGLNNIAQLRLAKRHPHHRYFADIYLYQANAYASELLYEELGDSFIGGYLWLERQEHGPDWTVVPTVTDYRAPSFISRACFRHDALGKSCASCPGKEDYRIEQNGVDYIVKVRSCLTVVEML